MRGLLTALAVVFAMGTLSAQSDEVMTIGADSLEYRYTPIDQTSRAQTGIERFGLCLNDYLDMSHDDGRRVSFSFVGAPAYSVNTGWRLAAGAIMRYRTKGADVPHSLSLNAMASLRGCYSVSLDGCNYLGDTRHRLDYGGFMNRGYAYLYGYGDAESMLAGRGEYLSSTYGAYMHYSCRVTSRFTVGVVADYNYESLLQSDGRVEAILEGADSSFSGLGVGVNFTYSTRRVEDVNLTRGIYLRAEYMLYPDALSSSVATFHGVNAAFDYYQPLWRGGLLVLNLYGEYHSVSTPWFLRATIGGDDRMRGYHYGRFTGCGVADAQVELRQRVWEGLVLAGWGGLGVVLSDNMSALRSEMLPNYGVGLRWYLNPTSVMRVDYGFGRGCKAVVVGYSGMF